MKVIVSAVADFPDGSRKIIDVEGRSVGVFRFGDTFYAIRNRCPHQWGPLCTGRIASRPVAEVPGEFRMDSSGVPLIACPWHGWEYDLVTGQSWMGPGHVDARTYEVEIEPGEEVVAEGIPPEVATTEIVGGRIPGPYKVDTIPISIEQDYVVIDY